MSKMETKQNALYLDSLWSQFIDDFDAFSVKILDSFNEKKIRLFNLTADKRIFLFILTRAQKTYSSILLLCKNGYGQDVAILLRSVLEHLITAKYILNDEKYSKELAIRFVDYKWIILKRHLPEQEKLFATLNKNEQLAFIERKKTILSRVENFKKSYIITSDRALLTWSGKTVRDMAKQISNELVADYDSIFRSCSRFSHPGVLGDKEYVIQNEINLIFSPLPSDIGVLENLYNTQKIMLEFWSLTDELFHLNAINNINALKARLSKLSFQPKTSYSKSTPNTSIKESIILFKMNN